MRDRLADPIDGIVDNDRDICEGGLWARDHEQVRKTYNGDAVGGSHLCLELFGQQLVFGVSEVDLGQGAGDSVEANL